MSAQLLSAKIAIVEEQPSVRPIQAAPTSVTGALGITERGPVGVATLVTSFQEYLRVFGNYTANSDLALAAKGFFESTGGGFFWVVRTVHYTDPTNPSSKTSAPAQGTLNTASLAQTAGAVTASILAPYVLVPGDTLVLALNGGGPVTATFLATPASRNSATGPFALSNGQTLTLQINGGTTQTFTFLTSNFANIAAATALEVANVINATIVGAIATVVSNQVHIATIQNGTGATVNVTGGTANGALAFTTGSVAGTGNVANIAAVQISEVLTVLNAAFGPAVVTNTGGAPTITSNTLGSSSSVQITSGGTAQSKFGFDTAIHVGNNAGTLATLQVNGKTDGAYGNQVSAIVGAATNGNAAFFNLTVQQNGATVEIFPNLTMVSTSANYAPTVVNSTTSGSNLIQLVDLFAATSSPNNRPANVTLTLSGGNDGLSGLADSDFTGSPVINQAAGTGLRAFDTVNNLGLLIVPGRATPVVHNAMISYCEATRFGSVFAILDPPANQSAQQMVTYVSSTALLYELSEFGAIYWPRVTIANPNTTVFGSTNTITVAPSGIIAGTYARNDAAQPGGVYEAPAGVDFGKLTNVLGLETLEVYDELKRDLVFPQLINPIVGLPGLPIHIDGARTLKDTGPFPTIGERRGVIFIETSLKSGLVFAKHRKIKTKLLKQLERTVRNFLSTQTRQDAFATDDPKTAFSLDFGPGLNPPSEAFARRVNGRIGIATAKPAEFIVLRVGQDTTALEAELAAAA